MIIIDDTKTVLGGAGELSAKEKGEKKEQRSAGKADSASKTGGKDTAKAKDSANKTTANKSGGNKTSAGKTSESKTTADNSSGNKSSAGKSSGNKSSANKASGNKSNAGKSGARTTAKAAPKASATAAKAAKKIRSDMAVELAGRGLDARLGGEIVKSRVDVDRELGRQIGKPEGIYLTLETDIVVTGQKDKYDALSDEICAALLRLAPPVDSVLVVCLGNPNLTADALGSRVFDRLTVTRHLAGELAPKVSISALCTNVMGATGIESFDIIRGVTGRIKPQLVIAVDSLASAAVGRIASAFQLCSSGITPGSGVANHRIRLDKGSLGMDVISIGVPLVVYASTIIAEAAGANAAHGLSDDMRNFIVTPKDIDILVEECAGVIAAGINKAFV